MIIHLSCKDWNRNALQSRGWELSSGGFENVLALSGDCPTSGYRGQASGVFDTDSVGLLKMFDEMNEGLKFPGTRKAQGSTMQRTKFFSGAVVNNYKLLESEVMPQYFKLAKKIDAGAKFIINQIGYDSQKQDELLKYMALKGLNVPLLCNVYVLSCAAARFFHDGHIPGVLVTDELLELAEGHAAEADKGKAFFLEFAAKQVAVARGLGFRGVYLGGHLRYDDYVRIFEIVDSFAAEDWKDFSRNIQFNRKGEFFYFEQDGPSGLPLGQVNRKYLASKAPEGLHKARRRLGLGYKLNRFVHDKVFESNSPGFSVGKRIYSRLDGAGSTVRKAAHGLEHALKILAFDCRDCGDCSLPEIAYLCPESQCAKNQRNGPCGGTRDGKCEVGDKQCIWALAYDRFKAYGAEEQMLEGPVIYKDAALKGTSAWANRFLDRDHLAKQDDHSKDTQK